MKRLALSMSFLNPKIVPNRGAYEREERKEMRGMMDHIEKGCQLSREEAKKARNIRFKVENIPDIIKYSGS